MSVLIIFKAILYLLHSWTMQIYMVNSTKFNSNEAILAIFIYFPDLWTISLTTRLFSPLKFQLSPFPPSPSVLSEAAENILTLFSVCVYHM